MKGFKDSKGNFHPIKPYKSNRKKRSPSSIDGVKIIKKTNASNSQQMIDGISKSFSHQPKSVKDKIKTITLKDKKPSEDFVAKIDTTSGDATFNKKPNMGEADYEALGDHEFEHIDFNEKLEKGNRKYEQFIKDGNQIEPFTPDLVMTLQEQEDAFIEGNFGILPDKRNEYPDEINSVVTEIETRQKLGLPTNILNEEEFEKAKRLVEELHSRKKRDFETIGERADKFRQGRNEDLQKSIHFNKHAHGFSGKSSRDLKKYYVENIKPNGYWTNFTEWKTAVRKF